MLVEKARKNKVKIHRKKGKKLCEYNNLQKTQ